MKDEIISSDFKNKLSDFFEGHELVELLDISVEDIVYAFPELILENMEELKEEIGYGETETSGED